MSDFFQTGMVATFHRLGKPNLDRMEEELSWYSVERPIALVLPSTFSELEGEALQGIVRNLREVKYIREIVVTLGPTKEDEFKRAKEFFSVLPQQTTLVWNSGERVGSIFEAIRQAGLPTGEVGKGRSVWMAYGYILSRRQFHSIALHDCDIISYNRDLPARLCYPVTNPKLDYDFCKGYYSRVTDRLHGRVTRLLVSPLIRSLVKIIGYHPLLVFFDSFRYPLAGEFSMDVDLARVIRIPGDWGLEVGAIAEVYRNTAARRVCQIDLVENYEHKHQALSAQDPSKGLNKMCIDICKTLFRTLASQGIVFTDGFFKTLVATYLQTAQEMLKRFEDDAAVNGLFFDRHEETMAVETFTNGIRKAAATIMDDPLGAPLITSWDRVMSAIPDIMKRIAKAVEADNK